MNQTGVKLSPEASATLKRVLQKLKEQRELYDAQERHRNALEELDKKERRMPEVYEISLGFEDWHDEYPEWQYHVIGLGDPSIYLNEFFESVGFNPNTYGIHDAIERDERGWPTGFQARYRKLDSDMDETLKRYKGTDLGAHDLAGMFVRWLVREKYFREVSLNYIRMID